MKKILLVLAMLLAFAGCDVVDQEVIIGDARSTITKIGEDTEGNEVYVKELVIKRVVVDGVDSYNIIFVHCTAGGKLLPGTVSNSYKHGKVQVRHTTIL